MSSQHSKDMSMVGCGVLLAGMVMLSTRRAKQSATTRHVTLEDIDQVGLEQVPQYWRASMSMQRARRMALSQVIHEELEDTFFLMAINKDFMKSADLKAARLLFPTSVKVRCLRNSLVSKAMEGTDWWPIAERLKGSNMYVFVKKDTDLKGAIEASMKMEKKYMRTDKLASALEKMGGADKLSFELKHNIGGIMADEWNVIESEDLPKFKDFPTKTELIGRIAGSIKQVTTKVAKGIKQVPTKIAKGIKETVEKGEEGGKSLVGDVTP